MILNEFAEFGRGSRSDLRLRGNIRHPDFRPLQQSSRTVRSIPARTQLLKANSREKFSQLCGRFCMGVVHIIIEVSARTAYWSDPVPPKLYPDPQTGDRRPVP